MVVLAFVCGAITGKLDAVAKAITDSAGSAVNLAIGMVGSMAFFLGLMNMLHKAGVLRDFARWVRPLMRRLFPAVPDDHPAMSMMLMNFIANMLGLANAATPFGLKAMVELNKLNRHQGTATDSMALFLAINASNVALLPTGVIALRASLGSTNPGSIVLTTLFATTLSTLAAGLTAWFLAKSRWFPMGEEKSLVESNSAKNSFETADAQAAIDFQPPAVSSSRRLVAVFALLICLGALGYAIWQHSLVIENGLALGWWRAFNAAFTSWALLLLVVLFVLVGMFRGVPIYDHLVEGGKEGFQVALRIIPYLVAILVAVGMLRAAGAIDLMVRVLEPVTSLVGVPAETLPMWFLRPLSGNGAYGMAAEIMKIYGPDSLIGQIVSTMQGSTETTFYVLALYFGVVNIQRTRYTVIPCLVADFVGPFSAVWLCHWMLG